MPATGGLVVEARAGAAFELLIGLSVLRTTSGATVPGFHASNGARPP